MITLEEGVSERTLEQLYVEAVEDLQREYELVFVDHCDQLTDEQLDALVEGDLETLLDQLSEFEMNSRDRALDYIVRDAVGSVIRRWELEGGADCTWFGDAFLDSPFEDELRNEITERDKGDWVRDLIRHTSNPLLRIVAIDEDNAYSHEEIGPIELLVRIGIEPSDENVKTIRDVIANASPEFSVRMGFWIAALDLEKLYDLPDGTKHIDLINPYFYFGNPFYGNGFVSNEPLIGTVRVHLSHLRTDSNQFGYSIDQIYGGVNPSSFDVEFEPVSVRKVEDTGEL